MSFQKPYQKLFKDKLLSKNQFDYLHNIYSGKIISLFYEIKVFLYLGVLLLSTGIGILIYQNIGSFGHIISIFFIAGLTALCFWYIIKKDVPFSYEKIKPPAAYFDYILLLGALLLVVLQGYIEFQYEFFSGYLAFNSLVSATFFFFLAYRYDHIGLLSMGITALGSFIGISMSPVEWQKTELYKPEYYVNSGIGLSLLLIGTAFFLNHKQIKKHFTFTYLNFGALLFFICTLSGIFQENYAWLYIILQIAGIAALAKYSLIKKNFLFLLYCFVFGYITLTYLVFLLDINDYPFYMFYFLLSCGGFIAFILYFRKYFKDHE